MTWTLWVALVLAVIAAILGFGVKIPLLVGAGLLVVSVAVVFIAIYLLWGPMSPRGRGTMRSV